MKIALGGREGRDRREVREKRRDEGAASSGRSRLDSWASS